MGMATRENEPSARPEPTTQPTAAGSCPACGHWPYSGSHPNEQGCFATAGTLYPCGCKHEGQPVPR